MSNKWKPYISDVYQRAAERGPRAKSTKGNILLYVTAVAMIDVLHAGVAPCAERTKESEMERSFETVTGIAVGRRMGRILP